eukprot:g2653.t1
MATFRQRRRQRQAFAGAVRGVFDYFTGGDSDEDDSPDAGATYGVAGYYGGNSRAAQSADGGQLLSLNDDYAPPPAYHGVSAAPSGPAPGMMIAAPAGAAFGRGPPVSGVGIASVGTMGPAGGSIAGSSPPVVAPGGGVAAAGGAPGSASSNAGGGEQQEPGGGSGQSRIIDSYIEEGKVVGERVVEEKFVVGVKSYRIVERTVEVPQVVVKEVTKIVKKPEIIERVVEKPKIEIKEVVKEVLIVKTIEKTIEVPEVIYEEKISYVPKIVYEDRIIEIPKVSYQENFVYNEQVEYREIVEEKIEEVVTTIPRTSKKYIEKPLPMRMEVFTDKKLPGEEDEPVKVLTKSEVQQVGRVVEIPKVSFQEFPVRKTTPVPLYRMVFPDGSKKLAGSLFGYPELPKPREQVPFSLDAAAGNRAGSGEKTVTNLGVNANLMNTTRPAPPPQLVVGSAGGGQQAGQYRPVGMDDGIVGGASGRGAGAGPSSINDGGIYLNQASAVSRFDQNSVHPLLRASA